jgi:hypothetical protein
MVQSLLFPYTDFLDIVSANEEATEARVKWFKLKLSLRKLHSRN